MKNKEVFLFVFFVFTSLFATSNLLGNDITGEVITGEVITGEASAQSTNVSVFVLSVPLRIKIFYPANISYTLDVTQLNYTVTNSTPLSGCWYSLNLGVTNSSPDATCSNFTGLSGSEGSNTWTVYTNDTSSNNASSSVTFTIDTISPTYSNNQTNTTVAGAPVKFSILWNDNIALNPNGRYIFSWNNSGVFVNDSAVNFTATPQWANVTKTLNSTVGLLIGYRWYANDSAGNSNNTEIFILTMTAADVTPPPPDEEEGGVGGGGAVVTAPEIISLDKDIIKISLIRGESKSEELTIRNVGSSTLNITLFSSGSEIENLLRINEFSFSLGVGESKTIILDFISEENTPLGLYQGKLIVKAGNVEKEVLISIEVESRDLLFDVSVEIPEQFLEIVPGEELLANIKLFNLGTEEEVEVSLDYSIRDGDGNIILSENETITVKTEISFPKIFKISRDVKTGDYLLYVRATYNTQLASASVWFKIIPKTLFERILPYLIIIIAVLIILIIIILLVRRLRHELQILKKHKEV